MTARILGLDFSGLRDVGGDLHQGELSRIMEEEGQLHGVVDETLRRMGDRKVLVFTVSVAQSKLLAQIFDRHIPNCARFISGETPPDERRQTIRDFETGKFRILCNCMVATEGFDCPSIGMVVVARPTKSRSLYAQMVGRGTRPLPGVVDGDVPDRAGAIARSGKPDCIILDFAGNAGRHSLASMPDILGGKLKERAVEIVKKIVEEADGKPVDIIAELERAEAKAEIEEKEKKEAEKRRLIKGRAKVDVKELESFRVYGIAPRNEPRYRVLPLSEGQKDLLRKQGVEFERLDTWKQRELFKETVRRFKQNLCSYRQAKILRRFGYSADCSFEQAKSIIDRLAQNNWSKT
jgi:type I site-specific restriction endonuclease